MDLYEVRLGAPIDTREFIFPRETTVEDDTEAFLREFVPNRESHLGTNPATTTGANAVRY